MPDETSKPEPFIASTKSAILSFLPALLSSASIIAILSAAGSTVPAANPFKSTVKVRSYGSPSVPASVSVQSMSIPPPSTNFTSLCV